MPDRYRLVLAPTPFNLDVEDAPPDVRSFPNWRKRTLQVLQGSLFHLGVDPKHGPVRVVSTAIHASRDRVLVELDLEVPTGYKGESGVSESFAEEVRWNYGDGAADGWMEGDVRMDSTWELDLSVVSITKARSALVVAP